MRALIPHVIAAHYQTGQHGGQFEAVSLFVDISGFTTLTETLMQYQKDGAEELTEALHSVFHPLVHAVYTQRGYISTFAGDAFTALFPLPDRADRADRADGVAEALLKAARVAVFIQQFLRRHHPLQTKYGDFPLGGTIGLGMGIVEWGILSGTRQTTEAVLPHAYFFRGIAIDSCVAAEERARSGEIVLDERLFPLPDMAVRALTVDERHRLTALHAESQFPPAAPLPTLSEDVLRPFVLDAVLNLIASGASAEFRQSTPVFLSFSEPGSREALEHLVSAVLNLAYEYGGYFNKLDFGDKGGVMLLLFGAPVAHENDVERAADFLLALREQNNSIAWSAGLTSGVVYAGLIGGEERSEYTAIGDVVNLAARLMAKAEPGTVWLNPSAARTLRASGYQLEALGAYAFKGKRAAVAVSRLVGKRQPGISGARFHSGHLIGREAELTQLAQWVAPIFQAGFAGLLTIYGEAGVGKSRLVYALRRHLEQRQQLRWFLCPTDEILRQSLNPFRHLLRGYFEQSPDHSPEENKLQFDTILHKLIAAIASRDEAVVQELERTRPFLGAMIDLHWPDSLYEQLEPKLRFENTLLAVKTFLQAESLRQPLVVQIEDVHWLDADSSHLLGVISRALAGYPFALLCTSRYHDDGSRVSLPIESDIPQQTLDLGALTADSIRALAAQVLKDAVADELVQFLLEKTSGNPFFAEQLLLDLHERGIIVRQEDGIRALTRQDTIEVPTSINAVLVARLDRLTLPIRQVVQTAAVLGREFAMPVLLQMLPDDPGILEKVRAAERERIWSQAGDMRYSFRHALLRDAAYDMQLRARLRDLHTRAGSALQMVYQTDLAPYYGDLVYHYRRAEIHAQELHYARLAGSWAASRYANAEAVTYLTRALHLTSEQAPIDRYDLLLAREQVYDRQGRRELQSLDLDYLEALVAYLESHEWWAEVALRQAKYYIVTGDYARASSAGERAIALTRHASDSIAFKYTYPPLDRPAKRSSDHTAQQQFEHRLAAMLELATNAYLHLGWALWLQGNYPDAQQQLQQALLLAQAANLPQVQAESLYQLGKVAYLQGDFATARRLGEEVLPLYRPLDNRQGEARTFNHLANIACDQGDYAAAITYYQQALTIHHDTGDRYNEGIVLGNLANAYREQGDFAAAVVRFEEALQLCRLIDDQQGLGITLINLGMLYNEQGSYDAATSCYRQALPICQTIGDQYNVGFALDGLGLLHQYQGDYPQAAAYYHQALEIRREIGDQKNVRRILALLALVAYSQGANDTARHYCQQVLEMGQNGSRPYEAGIALTCLGHIQAAERQHTEAITTYHQALTTLREAGRTTQALEALAGRARVFLAQGSLSAAQTCVAEILQHMESNPLLMGTDEPFQVYLTCYRVLHASQDRRAPEVLHQACTLLHERASSVQDERLRCSFLENVTAHRELLAICAVQCRQDTTR